ncbi:mitochondrial 37S ribosomal protein mS23 [Lipomyces oligophaga]|uniref:mitochondrial 37S ribosomal protein mS23 n=1 Tax=Lipomyces oligophaga TaxID=45792 RepID=UPI0034CDE954
MKVKKGAAEVLQRSSRMLTAGYGGREPAWFKPILESPPVLDIRPSITSEELQRIQQTTRKKELKAKDLFKPKKIVYPEDAVRKAFFEHHPWELARPKLLIEEDALEFTRDDWSKLEQDRRPLEGESVVQRTMWLVANESLSQQDAYNQACKEFYKLRAKQEIEQQTTEEEARMFGAVFYPSEFETGLHKEAVHLRHYKTEATKAYRTRSR